MGKPNSGPPLTRDWALDHHSDLDDCVRKHELIRGAEADCECGLNERHKHCGGCGRLWSVGDWSKPGRHVATVSMGPHGD